MSANHYASAIKVIYNSDESVLAKIAVEIAQSNPGIFMRACAAITSSSVAESVAQRVLLLVQSGEPIKAIKLYREMTGASLMDAKRYVDGVRQTVAAENG